MGAATSNVATADALEEARPDPALEEARLRARIERIENLERLEAEAHLKIETAFQSALDKLNALQAFLLNRKKDSLDLYVIGYGSIHEEIVSNCLALCKWFVDEKPEYSDQLAIYINRMFKAIASLPTDEINHPKTLLPFDDYYVKMYRGRIRGAMVDFESGDQSVLSADEVRKVLADLVPWLVEAVRDGLQFKRIK